MFAILKKIGQYGPFILLLCSIFLLRNKSNLLFYYILFFGISVILNVVLKGLIQQSRPCIDRETFQLMMRNKERYIKKNGVPYDIFGMPSGHSQSVVFSTIFIYLCLREFNILLFYILISLITLFQRVINNHHTVLQLVIGSLAGALLGYIGYNMARMNIEGKKTMKKDDYGPI